MIYVVSLWKFGVFEVADSRRVLRTLREMGEHMTAAAKTVLREGAEEMAQDAKSRCPVKTGRLRDSIAVEANSAGTEYKITANAERNGLRYGKIVEYSPRGQPFMKPAYEANINRIRAKMREVLRNGGNNS